MKAIIINAAPRMEGGLTHFILEPFMQGMRDAGADLDPAILGRLTIEPCTGCFTCYAHTPGACAHSDDMEDLVDRISAADMMILATPVYLDGMTNLAKSFVDRLVVFLDPHFTWDESGVIHPLRREFPPKLFLVSVCGYPGIFNFNPLLVHMKAMARNLHTEFAGALLRPAVFSCLMKKQYPDKVRGVMEAVRAAGRELAEKGRVSTSALENAAADICTAEELVANANAYWDQELNKRSAES